MVKQSVANTFEVLGQAAKQTGGQVKQEVKKMAETAGQQLTGTGSEQAQSQTVDLVQKALNQAARKRRLTFLDEELKALRARQKQQVKVEKVQEEKAIKQLEIQKEGEKEGEESRALQMVRQRGGTGERRKMGSGV